MSVNLPSNSLGSFEAYCRYAMSFPILSQEEERTLAEKAAYLDDAESAKTLVLHNIRFVISITRNYAGYQLPLSDLVQEGTVGLMRAIKRFDPHQGIRLVTFAVHWIKSEINEYVIKNTRIAKVATTKAQRKLFFNLRKMRRTMNYLSQNEAEDIADHLKVPVYEVLAMEQRLSNFDKCFDAKSTSSEDEDGLTYADTYADEQTTIEEPVVSRQLSERKQDSLMQAVNKLCDRDRDIIVNRWLTDEKVTLLSLAEKYEVSAERIRQIEKAAIKKMKVYFPLM